jgi:hypothetical protein
MRSLRPSWAAAEQPAAAQVSTITSGVQPNAPAMPATADDSKKRTSSPLVASRCTTQCGLIQRLPAIATSASAGPPPLFQLNAKLWRHPRLAEPAKSLRRVRDLPQPPLLLAWGEGKAEARESSHPRREDGAQAATPLAHGAPLAHRRPLACLLFGLANPLPSLPRQGSSGEMSGRSRQGHCEARGEEVWGTAVESGLHGPTTPGRHLPCGPVCRSRAIPRSTLTRPRLFISSSKCEKSATADEH